MIVATRIDLSRATRQDVFDYIVFALIQQGKPSLRPGGCAYRGKDGCRCAVGHLIADADYRPRFEGKNTMNILADIPSLEDWVTRGEERAELLIEIQGAHDFATADGPSGPSWLSGFRQRAREVAKRLGLDASIVSYREDRNGWYLDGADEDG